MMRWLRLPAVSGPWFKCWLDLIQAVSTIEDMSLSTPMFEPPRLVVYITNR